MSFLKLPKHKIYYETKGRGEVIIFLHGLGSKGTDWKSQTRFFRKNYRCVTIDFRGHGLSSQYLEGTYTVPALASDVIQLIKNLKISSAHLVGISLGGMVALQIATDKNYSNFVRSLTVVNALPELNLSSFSKRWKFSSRYFAAKFFGMKFLGKVLAKKLFPNAKNKGTRKQFREDFAKNNQEIYLKLLNSLRGWSVVNKLSNITCPTLFIASEHDYTTLQEKEFYAAKIPQSKVKMISNSHHAVTAEMPGKFNKICESFIKSLS